ncbi:MAG: alkaline phosphatase family protein [Anaerolineae bacterium]|nr:alkaline phosphatase family protein [Anaerolineae bacterium]
MRPTSHLLLTLFLALLFLSSCLPAPAEPLPNPATVPSTPYQPPTATTTPVFAQQPTLTPVPRPARALIIVIDGIRPDMIELTPLGNLQALMQDSAYSLVAQTIFPSSTLPSISSMLTGLCPNKHGIKSDFDIPEGGYALGTGIFELAHATGLRTVMVVGKEKLWHLTQPENLDVYEYINDRDTVIADRVAELIPLGFDLMFVHFPTPDGMGHVYGWLSPEQYSVLFRADQALQTILAALEGAGLRDETLIIITSDHGGHGFGHGTRRPEDMTIPWIISGPGVEQKVLSTNVNTTDTAATVAWALGLAIQSDWDGRPVLEAFGLRDEQHIQPRCG